MCIIYFIIRLDLNDDIRKRPESEITIYDKNRDFFFVVVLLFAKDSQLRC